MEYRIKTVFMDGQNIKRSTTTEQTYTLEQARKEQAFLTECENVLYVNIIEVK